MSNHDPVAIGRVNLQCTTIERPHESHEWYFYYIDSGPHIALCRGGEEKKPDGSQAISASDQSRK